MQKIVKNSQYVLTNEIVRSYVSHFVRKQPTASYHHAQRGEIYNANGLLRSDWKKPQSAWSNKIFDIHTGFTNLWSTLFSLLQTAVERQCNSPVNFVWTIVLPGSIHWKPSGMILWSILGNIRSPTAIVFRIRNMAEKKPIGSPTKNQKYENTK